MVTKPIREYTDSQGRRKTKGSIDIDLTIDALEMADKVDHLLIFSGDGDFRRLVDSLQRKGVRVTVVSTIRSQPPMVADELRRQADNFIDLYDLAPHIQRSQSDRQAAMAAAAARHGGGDDDDEGDDEDVSPYYRTSA